MKIFRSGFFTFLVAIFVSSAASAQGLPDSVADPYVRYQTAMESQDYDAAEPAAMAAWQAAEEAGIDIETTGLLADNYAQLAHRSGHYSEAVRAYTRSAEILVELDDDPLLIAQTWRLAAQSAFLGEDGESARRLADRAGDLLRHQAQSPAQAMELYRARLIEAYVHWESGSIMAAGNRARLAVSALEAAGAPATADTANLFFYAGVRHANERDNLEAAYHFTNASYIWRTLGTVGSSREVADQWAEYARRELDSDDRDTLIARLAASPFRPEGVTPSSDEDEGGTWRSEYPDGQVFAGGTPERRRPPRYPEEMLRANLQGVALMQFDVTEAGRTENVSVLYSIPHPAFGEAAIESVEGWRYEPLTVDGEAVARRGVVTTVNFILSDE
tara:strand:- start:608 stop:1771 length:1164 start_codon:yes stop_codon:yes gene_type:complete